MKDEELRELASKATPGERFYDHRGWIEVTVNGERSERELFVNGADCTREDGEFAAECSPDRITALLDRLQRLEALVTEARIWRNEFIGTRTAYDLRLEAAIDAIDTKETSK